MTSETAVTFRMLTDPHELAEAEGLFRDAQVPSGSLTGLGSAPVVLGAFARNRLVGATASYLAPDELGRMRVDQDRVHVTALAVEAGASGQGIGAKLMRLQRFLALQQGLRLVTWGQDPLMGRLSHLAIHRLGAVSRRVIGEGGENGWTLDVEWWVTSPRVKERLIGGRPEINLADVLEAGAPMLNAGRLDDQGLLHPPGADAAPSSATALVEVPHEMRALEERDPALAAEWRAHLAHLLSRAFGQGYWLTDYLWLRDERVPRAYFLLVDGERTLG